MIHQTVAEYLVNRLSDLGISDFFGVPGDFNFNILTAIEGSEKTRWIGCSNELNAGYAADGYARVRGIGAVVTTFGVGELSCINAIAGCYAENVPLIHIVGSPAMSVQNSGRVVHHTLGNGDFEVFQKAHAHVVAATTRLTADNATAEIERLIGIALSERRPVYINLPTDVCLQQVRGYVPRWQPDSSDLGMLDAALYEAADLIKAAKRPVIVGDAKVMRFGVAEEFMALVEKLNVPATTLFMGKGLIDETHPNFVGTFVGDLLNPEANEIVRAADLIIAVAPILGDQNTAAYTLSINRSKTIEIQHDHIMVNRARYDEINIKDALTKLTKIVEPKTAALPATSPVYSASGADGALDGDNLYPVLQGFIEAGDIVFCETGSIGYGAVQFRLPKGAEFQSQSLWMSIGWATPAAFGAAIAAPDRRVVLLTGDGSHQLTAQEVGQMIRYGCNAIVFLLNNSGYTIERYLADDMDDPFNEIAKWNYHKLPEAFGATNAVTAKVATVAELSVALKEARGHSSGLSYIEATMDSHAAPASLRTIREGRAAVYNAPSEETGKLGRPGTPQDLAACPG
ncbi:MAG: thiamine pyrophosphate-binding protein [Pseudomonadota bacterium]